MDWREDDRRNFSRVEFDADGVLVQADVALPVQLLDISVKGIHVRLKDDAAAGAIGDDPADLVIDLAGGCQIEMEVVRVHQRGRDIGFRCSSIDMNSAAHLRRLIELNLNMPDAAEQVLKEFLASGER